MKKEKEIDWTGFKEDTVSKKQIIQVVRKSYQHDMPIDICEGCKQAHHLVICIEDLFLGLGIDPKKTEFRSS